MAHSPVDALTSPIYTIAETSRSPQDGGVPELPGVYAWWIQDGVLPDVPTAPHPTEPRGLLYVGIAPSRESSPATLRSRILQQHIGGNVGSSTFRRSLAALLFESKGWVPVKTETREVLTTEDNAALKTWQRDNLRLAWVHVAMPWDAEATIIEEMQPALNLAGNAAHPFHETMSAARARFKSAAT